MSSYDVENTYLSRSVSELQHVLESTAIHHIELVLLAWRYFDMDVSSQNHTAFFFSLSTLLLFAFRKKKSFLHMKSKKCWKPLDHI